MCNWRDTGQDGRAEGLGAWGGGWARTPSAPGVQGRAAFDRGRLAPRRGVAEKGCDDQRR